MDYKQRIDFAKIRIQKARTAETVATTQKNAAEQQQGEVIAKLSEMGVTPETASEKIATLESKINADLTTVEGLIPNV